MLDPVQMKARPQTREAAAQQNSLYVSTTKYTTAHEVCFLERPFTVKANSHIAQEQHDSISYGEAYLH
jgi:hypothetical protein